MAFGDVQIVTLPTQACLQILSYKYITQRRMMVCLLKWLQQVAGSCYLGRPPVGLTSHSAASHVGMLVGLAYHSWGYAGKLACSVSHHWKALYLHACMQVWEPAVYQHYCFVLSPAVTVLGMPQGRCHIAGTQMQQLL